MLNLFTKSQSAFGLDVSGSSLKIFHFRKNGGRLETAAYTHTPLPKGVVASDQILDNSTFVYLLKQSLDSPQFGKFSGNYAVACLPEAKSFVRVIQLPIMGEGEADNAVPFEAESFIPLPIDQVYLDWQKIGESGDKMNVLIIASPRDFVDKYLETLEKAGIKAVALEVESQSCHRALVSPDGNETFLIVDMDSYRTTLIMVEDNNLQFTSNIPIAGNSFTESIARSLGVSSAKAEMIKRKVGIANTADYPNVKTALVPVLNNLAAEIKNILKFHREHSDRAVSKILLTGGSAKLNNLVEYLAPQFADSPEIKLDLASPWQHIAGGDSPLSAVELLGYTTVIGAALRGADFQIQQQ